MLFKPIKFAGLLNCFATGDFSRMPQEHLLAFFVECIPAGCGISLELSLVNVLA